MQGGVVEDLEKSLAPIHVRVELAAVGLSRMMMPGEMT